MNLNRVWRALRDYYLERKLFEIGFLTVIFLIIYVPAGLYRWSLKSTALIWSPLVWAFRPIYQGESTAHFVHGILTLTIYRFARWYSGFVLILFAGKLYIWLTWLDIAGKIKTLYGWSIISVYLVPESIPLWHLSAVVSAILTWLIYFRAEKYMHLMRGGVSVSDNAMDRFLKLTFISRNILSIYTAICTLYITKELAGVAQLLHLRLLGFPW